MLKPGKEGGLVGTPEAVTTIHNLLRHQSAETETSGALTMTELAGRPLHKFESKAFFSVYVHVDSAAAIPVHRLQPLALNYCGGAYGDARYSPT